MSENNESFEAAYMAVIPPKVRYDNKLSFGARLLYAEIQAMIDGRGYCWASVEYLSEKFEVSKERIRKWINELSSRGYVGGLINNKKGVDNE